METELQNKYDQLIIWLKSKKESTYYTRGCILMNDDVTSVVASLLCQKIYGKENTLNVIMPCYSNLEYLLKTTQFSIDCGVESKNIPIKQIYDDVIELDYDQEEFIDEGDKIKDKLRDSILEVLREKNASKNDKENIKVNAFRMGFEKTTEGYEIFMTGSLNLSTKFSIEELEELAIFLKNE